MTRRVLSACCVGALIAGCGGASVSDQRSTLEDLIRDNLPAQFRQAFPGYSVVLGEVGCTHSDGGHFDCLATLHEIDRASGEPVTEQLPIRGTCDDQSCQWKPDFS